MQLLLRVFFSKNHKKQATKGFFKLNSFSVPEVAPGIFRSGGWKHGPTGSYCTQAPPLFCGYTFIENSTECPNEKKIQATSQIHSPLPPSSTILMTSIAFFSDIRLQPKTSIFRNSRWCICNKGRQISGGVGWKIFHS